LGGRVIVHLLVEALAFTLELFEEMKDRLPDLSRYKYILVIAVPFIIGGAGRNGSTLYVYKHNKIIPTTSRPRAIAQFIRAFAIYIVCRFINKR
jgi:hypothetical protein